jgi:Rrf2 family transcriptional regulator, iron-sulfur cluster assembly transcription factor
LFRVETQQALRALTVLAQLDAAIVLTDLSARSRVPGPMLAKVLHRLARHGVVKGQPGPGGGYRLARPADEIRLREVVTLIEGPEFGMSCLFGLPQCSEESPCPLHGLWGEIRGRILDVLDRQSLADLARDGSCLSPTRLPVEGCAAITEGLAK